MVIVNLINKEESQVKYEKIKYPDGQVSIKFDWFNSSLSLKDNNHYIEIYSRFNSYEDLFYILSMTETLRFNLFTNIGLYIPCFFAQRSDARFNMSQSFDLKIICDIINNQNYNSVKVLDPHSNVLPALLNKCYIRENKSFIRKSIDNLKESLDEIVLISPDAGAYKKVFKLSEEFNLPLVSSNKYRSHINNNLTVNFHGDIKNKTCIIIDDYCDAGGTFIMLSNELKKLGAKKVILIVTHALFSKGIDNLKGSVDHIYCTNSIQDIEGNDFITQYKVI